MRFRIKPLVSSLCLLGLMSPAVLAANDNNNNKFYAATDNNDKLINTLNQRTQELEAEVHELQAEIKSLKQNPPAGNGNGAPAKPKYIVVVPRHHGGAAAAIPPGTANGSGIPQYTVSPSSPQVVTVANPSPSNPPSTMLQRPVAGSPPGTVPLSLLTNAPLTLGGMPVVTSPYLGVRSEFDASDLVSNFPNVNLAFRLLQQRQKIENVFCKNGQPYPDVPFVDLSGTVQPIIFVSSPYTGSTQSNIDLPTASLDAMGNINKWVMSFIRFSFDNNPPGAFIPPGVGPVIANSRIFLDQGFVTIGNLNRTPLYGTIGQLFVPFGKYSSNMINPTLPQLVGRTKARAVILGLYKDWKSISINLQGFAFRGDARTSVTSSRINQAGANFDLAFNTPKWNGLVGVSYISNIADAPNFQLNGAGDGFQGFAVPLPVPTIVNTNVLVHRVPAIDVHGTLGIGQFGFLAEYVGATTDFAPDDLTFNFHGARPRASSFEAVYNFNICNLPANIAVGYQRSYEALAILIPKERYLSTFNISLWKDTIESIEFRHDVNYGRCDFASGFGVPITTDGLGLGHSSNTLTGQIAVYF